MKIGFVGLGKMGMNMVTRLIRGGHEVVAFDADAAKREEGRALGASVMPSLTELVCSLPFPRSI